MSTVCCKAFAIIEIALVQNVTEGSLVMHILCQFHSFANVSGSISINSFIFISTDQSSTEKLIKYFPFNVCKRTFGEMQCSCATLTVL